LYSLLTKKEKETSQENFKTPISKNKNLHSKSSILSINSSGDKSSYRHSATREKFLRNSRNRKRKPSKLSHGKSQDSKYLTNKSSILLGNSNKKSKSKTKNSFLKQFPVNEESAELNSVLMGSKIKSQSFSHYAQDQQSSQILGFQDLSNKLYSSIHGKSINENVDGQVKKNMNSEISEKNDKIKDQMRNQMSEEFSCLSSKKHSQSLMQNQKREINKLNEKIKQYEKIVLSKNIIIDELEKELNG
jgi:hypothetical protein